MEKFRSSKDLKESMENIEKVVNFKDDDVEVHSDMDIVMTDAYDQSIKNEENKEAVIEEREEAAEGITLEAPEAPMDVKNNYTATLKLDEDFKDFTLMEDGRKNRISARDENDTDLYLDYDMSEFVYEMLSAGSKGITNIAPRTPLAKQKKKGVEGLFPIKRFSPNGSQINNRRYILLFDLSHTCSRDVAMGMKKLPDSITALAKKYAEQADVKDIGAIEAFDLFVEKAFPEAEKVYEMNNRKFKEPDVNKNTYINDLLGYTFISFTKEIGTPQIGQAGYDTVVYSNSTDVLELAREGAASYFIECGPIVPRRSITSHWDYSMVVYCPKYSDGEPMLLEDFLAEHELTLDDVFESSVAQRFKNAYAKADTLDAEFKRDRFIDSILDQYADQALDIDPDDESEMMALYKEMCAELTAAGVTCDTNIQTRFSDETGFEF